MCQKQRDFFCAYIDSRGEFSYLVTAKHVVVNIAHAHGAAWLRVNNKDGTVSEIQVPNDKWSFHPKDNDHQVDVAICPITFSEEHEVAYVPIFGRHAAPATRYVMAALELGIGDEVVTVGLFKNHYGKNRNVPIVRIGNLAAAAREEPVHTAFCGETDAYLIEARSIGGLSGSPVFINMPPVRLVNGTIVPIQGSQFYLLGLVHGHFDIPGINENVDDGCRKLYQ